VAIIIFAMKNQHSGFVQNMNYNGNTYTGQVKDGKPHGSGKLVYNATQQIRRSDPKLRKANNGDYFDGEFKNGEPTFGTFYDKVLDKTKRIDFGG
jgi:hypothetical protein